MLERSRRRLKKYIEVKSLGKLQFSIISNNCWGYEIYNILGRSYNTPFVGLYLFPSCYLKLLEQFENIFEWELKFINQSQYFSKPSSFPIGQLPNGSEIHFMHYESEKEAYEKWYRRLRRLESDYKNGVRLLFKFCDAEAASNEDIKRFHELPIVKNGHRISYALFEINKSRHLYLPLVREAGGHNVIDGKKLFYRRYEDFDFIHWAKTGKVQKTLCSRLLSLITI